MLEALALQAAGAALPALMGGGGGPRISTSISNTQNISTSPVILNNLGQGPFGDISPSGGAYAAPSTSSSAAGNDGQQTPSYLPTPTYQRNNPPLYGDPSIIGYPSSASPIPGGAGASDGNMMPLLLGGGALLLLLTMDK